MGGVHLFSGCKTAEERCGYNRVRWSAGSGEDGTAVDVTGSLGQVECRKFNRLGDENSQA